MNYAEIKAVLLAAGKSERIRSAAGNKPKPLLKIDGATILVHNLRLLARHGIHKAWVNLHYRADQIKKEIGNGKKWGVSVSYSYETKLLGTSGAAKKLSGELSNQTFLVLYGDNYTNCNLSELIHLHRRSSVIATIAIFNPRSCLNSNIAGGVVKIKSNGEVTGFIEGNSKSRIRSGLKNSYVNAGIYIFEPEIFEYIPDGFSDFGREVFPNLLKNSVPVATYMMDGFCFAADTPGALSRTKEIVRRQFKGAA